MERKKTGNICKNEVGIFSLNSIISLTIHSHHNWPSSFIQSRFSKKSMFILKNT